uniref:Gag-pol polyprotein n=1 Tax=Solanum tuberosum TaxID=4113 RepID=M1DMZ6_SOLTU
MIILKGLVSPGVLPSSHSANGSTFGQPPHSTTVPRVDGALGTNSFFHPLLGPVMTGRPARRNVDPQDQGVPNAPEVQPLGEVSNDEFRDATWMLSQVVANEAGQQKEVQQDVADTSRIPAPPDIIGPRGATSGTCGGANCLYAITTRQKQENSPDVVTGMIKVFTFDVYMSRPNGTP